MSEFEILKEKAANLSLCEKWNTKPVMGEGPVPCRVVLVGEAPGASEEREGRPFVGRAGKLLNKTLEKFGLDRKNFYITNVVKCRPPENRKPKPEEVRESLPILEEELEIVKPEIVVLLGDTAVKALLDKNYSITRDHGRIVEKNGRKYFITAHPSAALRFVKFRKIFETDIEKLSEIII